MKHIKTLNGATLKIVLRTAVAANARPLANLHAKRLVLWQIRSVNRVNKFIIAVA